MDSTLHTKKNHKKRLSLSSVFGLEKSMFSTNRDEPPHYHDTKFTTGLFKRRPSLINRPKISGNLERKIRRSSVLLAESILNQGEQTQSPKQTDTAAPDKLKTSQATIETRVPCGLRAPISTNAVHDSAVDLRTQQAARLKTEILLTSPFHDLNETGSVSNHESSSVNSPATTCSDMTFATGLSSIEPSIKSPVLNERQTPFDDISGYIPSQDKQGLAFLVGTHHQTSSSEDIEVFLNSDSTLVLGRMPSLSRPLTNASHSIHKPRLDIHVQETPSQPPSPKKGYQSKFVEFGATVNSKDDNNDESLPSAIIVDSNGIPHGITPAQETQRNMDLQLAVQEKMHTGMIATTSIPAISPSRPHNPIGCDTTGGQKPPFWSFKAFAPRSPQPECECQPRQKTVKSFFSSFQTPSIFGFAKRNVGAARNKDTSGFSRMAEDT